MTTSTLPRTQVLVRGSNAWRITKYNDYSFVARNNRGVTHTYDNEYKCNRFWDFLESVGFKLREDAWSLKTLVVREVSTPPITPAPAADPAPVSETHSSSFMSRGLSLAEDWNMADRQAWK